MGSLRESLAERRELFRALAAAAALALVIGLIAIGLAKQGSSSLPASAGSSDIARYNSIVVHMREGESYYPAAITELREHQYPLRPFATVRLPTLAWFLAAMPNDLAGRAGLAILAAITFAAWAWRLGRLEMSAIQYGFALMCLASGIAPALLPMALPMHEVWAGLLIALSLALRRPGQWLAAAVIGTLAALTRELAAAYLLVMMVMALKERRYGEAGGWTSGLVIFAVAIFIHAMKVNELVTATDLASPGWLQIGGWQFVLKTAQWNVPLSDAPAWLIALVLPPALLGLTASSVDQRVLLTVAGYIMAFTIVGRDDNFYWGLLIAPLWPMGLATMPSALAQRIRDIQTLFAPARTLTPSDTSRIA